MRGNWFALVLCAVVVSTAVVAAVGNAGPKDANAKPKAKAAGDAKAAPTAAAGGDAAGTAGGAKEKPKERKSLRDWQRMNDAAYRELEDAWMDDEEDDPDELMPTKWAKGPDGKRVPPMPRGPKMEMGFATLQPGTTKDQCEELAIRWSQLLSTGAVAVKAYAIEDDKILLGVDGGYPDMFKVKDFVLEQKETVEFEWQQQKFKPTHTGAGGGGGKQTKEDKAAAAKREKEAELRRKIESGELFDEKNKAKAKANAKAKDNKTKTKVKAKDAAAKADAKAKAKADKPTPKAEKKKDSAAKPKPADAKGKAKAKAKDEL